MGQRQMDKCLSNMNFTEEIGRIRRATPSTRILGRSTKIGAIIRKSTIIHYDTWHGYSCHSLMARPSESSFCSAFIIPGLFLSLCTRRSTGTFRRMYLGTRSNGVVNGPHLSFSPLCQGRMWTKVMRITNNASNLSLLNSGQQITNVSASVLLLLWESIE